MRIALSMISRIKDKMLALSAQAPKSKKHCQAVDGKHGKTIKRTKRSQKEEKRCYTASEKAK